jgi:hypothetical protein
VLFHLFFLSTIRLEIVLSRIRQQLRYEGKAMFRESWKLYFHLQVIVGVNQRVPPENSDVDVLPVNDDVLESEDFVERNEISVDVINLKLFQGT